MRRIHILHDKEKMHETKENHFWPSQNVSTDMSFLRAKIKLESWKVLTFLYLMAPNSCTSML